MQHEPCPHVAGATCVAMAAESVYPAPARLPEGSLDGNANQWADRTKSIAQFGYDADKQVDAWWAEHREEVLAVGSEQAKL